MKRRLIVSFTCAFCVATHHSPSEIAIVIASLVRARRAERAALDDLRVVVGEPEQRAGQRGAEHPDRLRSRRVDRIRNGTANAITMMIPPIVGVPALVL